MGLSVKFYLESRVKGDKNKPLPIFLHVRRTGDKLIKLYIERKCSWHGWDQFRNRAKKSFPGAAELNGFLADIEEEVTSRVHSNSRKGILTSKADIDQIIANLGGKELRRIGLVEFADQYVANSNLAPNTKKGYQTTINALKEYSSQKRIFLDFSSIDQDFYEGYTGFLWKKGMNDNSVGTHIKHIKSIMTEAFERDLHSNLKFKRKGFHVFRRDADTVYLSTEEINTLLGLDLAKNEKLRKVRDVFCVNCLLGLRYSDLIRVTKEKIVNEVGITLLKIETQKTGEIIRVPLNPKVLPILERYDYNLPVISSQKFNEYLKELCNLKLAKLDTAVEITTSKAGKKVHQSIPKSDLITSHTARRSFATNLYLQGIQSQYIMAVTGHRTEKAFRSYLKLSDMDKLRELDRHFKSQFELKIA